MDSRNRAQIYAGHGCGRQKQQIVGFEYRRLFSLPACGSIDAARGPGDRDRPRQDGRESDRRKSRKPSVKPSRTSPTPHLLGISRRTSPSKLKKSERRNCVRFRIRHQLRSCNDIGTTGSAFLLTFLLADESFVNFNDLASIAKVCSRH
jgi:hypothetical protein